MMNVWSLPTSLEVDGVPHEIRTDFRDILNIIAALNDPNLTDEAKGYVFLNILYKEIPADIEAAYKAGMEFISAGTDDEGAPHQKLMDWEQDAPLLIPAINKVAGTEVRSLPYCHWWTFIGYYMEIGESTFSNVVSIRQKKAKGKKLDKHEQEFYRDNKSLIDIKSKLSDEEQEAHDNLLKLLDGR